VIELSQNSAFISVDYQLHATLETADVNHVMVSFEKKIDEFISVISAFDKNEVRKKPMTSITGFQQNM
jgi:hypothetical protein